jgi:prephenate dehydrogenase
MAIRRRRLARRVVGWSRKLSTLKQAKRRGAIDEGTTSLPRAVHDADLTVLATPVDAIVPLAMQAARFMQPGSILTDVGSTKAQIVKALERRLTPGVAFVGAHPLAGSEQRGIAAASVNLFDGSTCIVTVTRRTDRRALARVRRFWSAVADRVVVIDPVRHDRLLAAVSHLPHLLAFCLVGATVREALALAPRSFLDATRVAKSDPTLWDDIFLSNRAALLAAMDRFDRSWQTLHTHLSRRDRTALHRAMATAHAKRHALKDR